MESRQLSRQGRESYRRHEWTDAFDAFSRADREAPLDAEDLERLATTAYLVGRDAECAEAWARAHQEYLRRSELERAVRCALWLAFALFQKGERARGGGWVGRAERLLEHCSPECVERGYLLVPTGLKWLGDGDGRAAHECFRQAWEIGDRCGDTDLTALALHSRGRVLIRLGEIDDGVALLDEAMAAIEAGEVSAMVVGDVYCSVIEGCLEIFDLSRAREWTTALTHWCESQSDLVPYRGQCLVRRAEIMQLRGTWMEALEEADRACQWLSRPPGEPAAGAAFYQQAELHRLRGDFSEAEAAYRTANQWGKNPQPGLAQLRLAQGRVDDAAASLRRAMEETQDRHLRARLLPACVEIMLAAGEASMARTALEDLAEIAREIDAPFLHAAIAQARGAVLLAEGDATNALAALRAAERAWQTIEVPFEAARVRVLIGLACGELGDRDTAELELEAARRVFQELGATPELARMEELVRRRQTAPPKASGSAKRSRAPGGLTRREVQVLRLVATGRKNRAIARELFISERTVGRHISNIFRKLSLSTRSAATAYAYENDLV